MKTEQTRPAEKTNSSGLTEPAKEARNAYQRNYYKKNRDKVKSWQARYWAKKAATDTETEVAED